MFFNKQKIIDAEEKIKQQQIENQSLKNELETVHFEKQVLEQKINSTENSDSYYQGLFQLMQEFGNSMIAMQGSLAVLASVMTSERDNASNTAVVLSDTHSVVSKISSSAENHGNGAIAK